MTKRTRRRFITLGGIIPALLVVLAACVNNGANQAPALEIVSANATSKTSIVVTFNQAVGDGAEAADNYRINAPNGSRLRVIAAYPDGDGMQVTLATERQELVTYALTVRNVSLAGGVTGGTLAPQGSFGGSGEDAPIVASAIALSTTEVLVTFGDPGNGGLADMGDGAEDKRFYEIVSPNLAIVSVAYVPDGSKDDESRVIVTTAPMKDKVYTIRVTNVVSSSGDRLIDPYVNTASFPGIAANDTTPPTVTDVYATDATMVVVQFSEPVSDNAADPSNYAISDSGSGVLAVFAAELNDFKTVATLTTAVQTGGETYTAVVTGISDRNGNALGTNSTDFMGADGPVVPDRVPPKLVTAGSTSNTSVLVGFSEAMDKTTAETIANYRIHADLADGNGITTQAIVEVSGASLSANGTSVTLTTLSQSELDYTLVVTGVTDAAGNQLAPQEPFTPPFNEATFFGTGLDGFLDTDGDGVTDAEEQRGWTVTVELLERTVLEPKRVVREVTSDPNDADTDNDGVPDGTEKDFSLDPRDPDTDDDELSDYQELNFIYSNPFDQDTDEDGLADGLEFNFFNTSPIHEDTDGDQFRDDEEVFLTNRDPLISDIPQVQITIGDVALTLDERYTFTDITGTTQEVSSSTSSTLEQGTDRTYGTSDSETLSSSIELRAQLGFEAKFPAEFGVSGETEITGSEAREYNTTVSQESSTSANEAFNNSIERSQTFESTSEVVREIVDAAMRLTVDIRNDGDVAFAITNLELTALQQDPIDRSRSIPIATLLPASALDGDDNPTYRLGPLVPTVGPIIFKNRDVFPATIQNLLRDPRGLIFRIANYNIEDENGRVFAFSSQEANDRTVKITIDYGNGDVELFRIAVGIGRIAPFADTNSDGVIDAGDSLDNNGDGTVDDGDRIVFDANGDSVGITMRAALENVLGLAYGTDYKTATGQRDAPFDTVNALTEINAIANNLSNRQAWIVYNSNPSENAKTNFNDIVLRAGESYTFAYLQDKDDDRLFAREEYLYGSCDGNTARDPDYCTSVTSSLDTDADSIKDFDEVRTGVEIVIRGRTSYLAYSDPRRVDSDSDGFSDFEERTGCIDANEDNACDNSTRFGPTDPRARDSDEDGLSDFDEINGYAIRFFGDTDFTLGIKSDPVDPDSDGDGLGDGFEVQIGADPRVDDVDRFIDTDEDGLSDSEETGYTVQVNGVATLMTSSKYSIDTDSDGLPDLLEHIIGSNPGISSRSAGSESASDSDGDGLSDFDEFDPDEASTFTTAQKNEFISRCASAPRCSATFSFTTFVTQSPTYGTDLADDDTDSDNLTDYFELITGWNVTVTPHTAAGSSGTPVTTTVYSDPLDANSDTDGWNDGVEYNGGTLSTDPNLANTDGDDKDDSTEGRNLICAQHISATGPGCRDPRVPDQRITVRYTSILFREDGDDLNSDNSNDAGEVMLRLVSSLPPSSNNVTGNVHVNYVGGYTGTDGGGLLSINTEDGDVSQSFTSLPNYTHTYIKEWDEILKVSGEVAECDGDCPTIADFAPSFGFTYSGEITNADSNINGFRWTWDEKNGDGSIGCAFDINCDKFTGELSISVTFD